jgi:hypothetical protein
VLLAVACALVAAGLTGTEAARAADPPRSGSSPADSAARAALPKTAPFKVMLRSAVVPGWGQLYNHQPLKAALVVGVEGALVASALRELKLQNDAIQRAADLTVLGDTAGATRANEEADTHRNRKISWIWWEVAAHLLSMADAYVDAQLSTFAADRPDRASLGPPLPEDDRTVSLALRVRF